MGSHCVVYIHHRLLCSISSQERSPNMLSVLLVFILSLRGAVSSSRNLEPQEEIAELKKIIEDQNLEIANLKLDWRRQKTAMEERTAQQTEVIQGQQRQKEDLKEALRAQGSIRDILGNRTEGLEDRVVVELQEFVDRIRSFLDTESALEVQVTRLVENMRTCNITSSMDTAAPPVTALSTGTAPAHFPMMASQKSSGAGWDTHHGTDCYQGRGGVPLSPDPYHQSLTLAQCQAACGDRCQGVVVRAGGTGSGICYRRSSISIGSCVRDPAWNVYVKRSSSSGSSGGTGAAGWRQTPGVDCYQGRGGTPIHPDPHSNSMSVSQCQAACSSRPECQGVITGGGGKCYLRTNINVSQCVRDSQWTLHLSPRYSGSTGVTPTATPAPTSSRYYGCNGGVRAYPRNLPNSHYYTRLCNTYKGLRVVSGRYASDRAIQKSAELLDRVTDLVDPRVMAAMTRNGFRHAVMGTYPSERTTNIPEHAFLEPVYWNERARGLGATMAVPVGSGAEENVLCHSNDRYKGEDITIHEFAHSLHLTGLAPVFPGFDQRLQGLYYAARTAGVWGSGHYAMTDFKEYFAEGVQSFFGCNMADYHAPVTRDLLRRRDPNLYNFIAQYLGNNQWQRSC